MNDVHITLGFAPEFPIRISSKITASLSRSVDEKLKIEPSTIWQDSLTYRATQPIPIGTYTLSLQVGPTEFVTPATITPDLPDRVLIPDLSMTRSFGQSLIGSGQAVRMVREPNTVEVPVPILWKIFGS